MPVQESRPEDDDTDAPSQIANLTGHDREKYEYDGGIPDLSEMDPVPIDEWETEQTDR